MPEPNRIKGLWKKRVYSKEEKQKIKEFVPKLGYLPVAKILNRPAVSIRKWAIKLGIERFPEIYDSLSDTEAAYIAGLLDGEGCFRVCIGKIDMKKKKKIGCISTLITITISDKKPIKWLQKKLSYFGYEPKIHIHILEKAKALYNIEIGGMRAASLAKRILPYLIIKKEHAKLIIEFHKIHKYGVYTAREIEIALKFYELNKNGFPGRFIKERFKNIARLNQLYGLLKQKGATP